MKGHTYKRGKTWSFSVHIGYDAEGRRKRHQAGGFRTRKEAEHALAEVVHRLTNNSYVSPTTKTLGEFLLDDWLPTIKGRDLKSSTYNSYESNVKHYINRFLGMDKLQQLGPVRVNEFYAHLAKAGSARTKGPLAPKTIRNVHVTLRKALADAVRWNLIPRNPCEFSDPPKVRGGSRRQMKTWDPEQLATFLAAMQEDRLFPAFHVSALTGLRRAEVLGLRWRDVDLDRASVSVRQTLLSIDYRLEYSGPKNGRERQVALDSDTVAILREWKAKQLEERLAFGALYVKEPGQDLVFTAPEGGPLHPDFYSQSFDRAVKKLDLPRITLHDLRHTHATIGLQAGIHPKIISERLGHATVAFTLDVYSHAVVGLQEQAVETIAALIRGKRTGT